jgi:hypothetical protein
VAFPATIRAQTSTLPSSLQPATRSAIERLADSVARDSLPVQPLYDKAAEGVLKGADDARILTAVRGLADRLREARVVLGPRATDAELTAGASALHAGATQASIRELAAARDGRALAVPLAVLANLIADGVPARVASESVTNLVRHGAHDDELTALRLSIARDIERGASPDGAVAATTRRLLQTIDGRERTP